jgi:hypothetical protein
VLTVLGCTDKCKYPKSGETILTSGRGTAYNANDFDEIGYTKQGIALYEKQKSVSPAAGPN